MVLTIALINLGFFKDESSSLSFLDKIPFSFLLLNQSIVFRFKSWIFVPLALRKWTKTTHVLLNLLLLVLLHIWIKKGDTLELNQHLLHPFLKLDWSVLFIIYSQDKAHEIKQLSYSFIIFKVEVNIFRETLFDSES